MPDSLQEPQDTDAETLHAYLNETAGESGVFAQNMNVAAATIGWTPTRLGEAMQELVADGKVEAAHDGGDPTKIAGSRWRIVDYAPPGDENANELDGMTVPQLRAYADEHGIDLEDATKKDDVRAAIDLALEERDA